MNDTEYATDETLLDELIYTKFKDSILAHDSYTCETRDIPTVPFPKERRSRKTRVGLNIRLIPGFFAPECPIKCRPIQGQNWTYC